MSILNEPVLTLAEAAQRLPGRPHVSTLHRWRIRGVCGVRLCTTKVGGRRVVALSDLEDFLARVTAASDKNRTAEPHTSARRKREIATAEATLVKAGIVGNQRVANSNNGSD